MSLIPNNTILEQLKCFTCTNYISVGPVTQAPNGYNCGRCYSANGNEISTPFEVFAKNSLFPCRYDVNGCNAKVAYGEEVINHEKVCEYRPSSCPVVDSCECEWNGLAITSIEHCLNEHKESIVESNEFKFNASLRKSMNKKIIIKRTDGELLLLHLLYSEEMGLSINTTFFVVKNQKRVLRYTLVLQSLDEKHKMELESREITPSYCFKPSLEWIPFNTLCCLDKTTLSIIIKFARYQNAALSDGCDNCDQALPLYILKCSKNHRLCNKCQDVEQKCIVCSASLQINSNYNAMKTEKGSLGCCNVVYGCNFFGSLSRLQVHEQKCALFKCFLKDCQWRGIDCNFWNHVTSQHYNTGADRIIVIKDENIKNNTYFLWFTIDCKKNLHSHQPVLLIIQILVDDTKNTIKLIANANMLSVDTIFVRGEVHVSVGNNIIHKGPIGKMNGAVFDRSGEIQFCRSFLKQQALTIEVVNCRFMCQLRK